MWIALDRATYRVIGFHLGNRDNNTLSQFYESQLIDINVNTYHSDYWESYKMLPKYGESLKMSKSLTTHIESFNSLIRHYLARFHRKTKCYSKSQEYVQYSLILLFNKLNSRVVN